MKYMDLNPATSRLHRTLLGALIWLAAWFGLCAPAQAGWEAYTNGEAGFGVPATYANLRTIDFETGGTTTATAYNTLTTEDTANRLLFTTPASASWSQTSTTSKTGMSNKKAYFQSTTSSGYKTLTIDFTNGGATGGTSYVAFMVHMGLKDQDGAYVKYNFSDGSSQTLYTCKATTSGCIGAYVNSSFLTSLINLLTLCLFGCNQYDSVYMTYTPSTGVKITSIVFGNGRCDGCGLLGLADLSQDMWIDNISYVDPTVAPHHLELTTSSSTASSGSTTTFTIKACNNADCSELYTTGMTGTFSLTGTGLTPTYPGGQTYTIGARSSSTTITASITPSGTATAALTSPSVTPTGSPSVYCGMGVAAASGNSCNLTITQPLHHVRLTTSSSSALTCSPATYTITACANADCSTPYTGGLTGSLSISGVTVNYPSGASFSIGVGSSSTTVSAHMTSVGTGTASLTGLSSTPTNSPGTFCGMGVAAASGGSCAVSVASSALLLSIPAHYSDASATATITAVKASDNSASCTPAFASVSKNVLFKCTYSNPGTGSLPVRMGGSALNASNSTSAACDGTGRSVSLSFDASGVATTTLQYADVGQVGVNATYTGSGTDAGLSMTGSTTFIAAPLNFVITGPAAGNIRAGNAFSATVYARNVNNANTPNFGRESAAEGVTLSFVRTHPSGTAAANGSFTGSVGAFTNGTASATNLTWNQVGKGDVVASLTDAGNDGYLGSGLKSAGSTAGWTACAAEGATCTLPTGATATVFYGANGFYKHVTGQTGSVACTNAVFTDPITGTAKNCYYVVTSGASPGGTGAVGPFIPYRFKTEVTNACTPASISSSYWFTYSGQPFTVKVTALSADGSTITTNYDGTANTSPNYAKVTTLSEAVNSGTGSFSNDTIAVASFSGGVATVTTPTFTFTNKLTKPTSVTVRATDTDSVTSSGGTEGSLVFRSGRLKVSNAFGSEKTSLQIPVQAQYWACTVSNACAWALNSVDSACTVIPTSAIVRGNYMNHKGAASATWTTTPTAAVTIGTNCSGSSTPGIGCLTLGAPNPSGSVGSVDFAFNLGSTTSDASCLSTPRPASTGANLPWFRSQYGSGNNCTDTTYTRDPSGRATFGVYSPESKKAVFTNELY